MTRFRRPRLLTLVLLCRTLLDAATLQGSSCCHAHVAAAASFYDTSLSIKIIDAKEKSFNPSYADARSSCPACVHRRGTCPFRTDAALAHGHCNSLLCRRSSNGCDSTSWNSVHGANDAIYYIYTNFMHILPISLSGLHVFMLCVKLYRVAWFATINVPRTDMKFESKSC